MGQYMLNNLEPSYNAPPSGDSCHECSCGEDCQCLLDVLPGRGVEWMSSAAETLAIFSTTTFVTRVAALNPKYPR
jgi:hypothetical protein